MSSSQNNDPRKSGSKRKSRKSRALDNKAAESNKDGMSLPAANSRSLENAREGLTNKEECNWKNKLEIFHGRLNALEGEQHRNNNNIEMMRDSLQTVCDRVCHLEGSEKKIQAIETRLTSLDSRNENMLQETRMCREESSEQKTSVENLKERLEQLETGTLKELTARLSQVETSNEINTMNVCESFLNPRELKQMSSESCSRFNDTELMEIPTEHLEASMPNSELVRSTRDPLLHLEENQDNHEVCGAAVLLSQNERNTSAVKDDIQNDCFSENQSLVQLEEKEESNSECNGSAQRDCLQNKNGGDGGGQEEKEEDEGNRGIESNQVNVEETEHEINGKEDKEEKEDLKEAYVREDVERQENIGESENQEVGGELDVEVHKEMKQKEEIEVKGREYGQERYENREEENQNEIAMQDENVEVCAGCEEEQRIREKIESEEVLENDAEKSDENWREMKNGDVRETKNEERLEECKQEEVMEYEEEKIEIKVIEGEEIGAKEDTKDDKRGHNIRKREGATARNKVKWDDIEDNEKDIEKQTKIENERDKDEEEMDERRQKQRRNEEKENYKRTVSSEEISLNATLIGMQEHLDHLKIYTQINVHDLYDSLNRQDDSLKEVVLRLTRVEEKCGNNKLEETDEGKKENDSVTGHLGVSKEGQVKEDEGLGAEASQRTRQELKETDKGKYSTEKENNSVTGHLGVNKGGQVKEDKGLGAEASQRRRQEGEESECREEQRAHEACDERAGLMNRVEPSSSSSSPSSSSSAVTMRLNRPGEGGLQGVQQATCIPGSLPVLCAKVCHQPEYYQRERPSSPDSDGSREATLTERVGAIYFSDFGSDDDAALNEPIGAVRFTDTESREASFRGLRGGGTGGATPFTQAGSLEASLRALRGSDTGGTTPVREAGSREASLREMSSYGAGRATHFREAGSSEASLREMSVDGAGGARLFRETGSHETSLRTMPGYGAGGASHFTEAGSREASLRDMSGYGVGVTASSREAAGSRVASLRGIGAVYGAGEARPFSEAGNPDELIRGLCRRHVGGARPFRQAPPEDGDADFFAWLRTLSDYADWLRHRQRREHLEHGSNSLNENDITTTASATAATTGLSAVATTAVTAIAPVSTSFTPVPASTTVTSSAPILTTARVSVGTDPITLDSPCDAAAQVTSLRQFVDAVCQTFPAPATDLTRVSTTESTFPTVGPSFVTADALNRTPARISTGIDPLDSDHAAVLPATVISPRLVMNAYSQTSPSLATSLASVSTTVSTSSTVVPSFVSTLAGGSLNRTPASVSTGTDPLTSDSGPAAVLPATVISPRPVVDACIQTFTSLGNSLAPVSTRSTLVPSPVSIITDGASNRAPACVSIGTCTEPVPTVSHASVSTTISIPCEAEDVDSQTQEHEEEDVAVSLLAVNTPSEGDGKTVFFFGCEEGRAFGNASTAENCTRPERRTAREDSPQLTHLSQILHVSGSRRSAAICLPELTAD